MNLEEMINEVYRGFGQSSHLNVEELRLLYYGRPDVYLSFTDDGDMETEHNGLPDCYIAYDVRDVVGRKVQDGSFYGYVYRIKKNQGSFIDDVRRYSNEQLSRDMDALRSLGIVDEDEFDRLYMRVGMDTRIRHTFERLWRMTQIMAQTGSDRNTGSLWKEILLALGYVGFSDPSRSGMLGKKEQRTLYIDYERREDLDILPIQSHRVDPRRRVERQIERYRRKMRGSRNRVSRRRDTDKRIF